MCHFRHLYLSGFRFVSQATIRNTNDYKITVSTQQYKQKENSPASRQFARWDSIVQETAADTEHILQQQPLNTTNMKYSNYS